MRNIPPEVPVPLSDTVKPAGDGGTMALERLFASLRPELLRFAWWLWFRRPCFGPGAPGIP
jgi:hypothetical protein